MSGTATETREGTLKVPDASLCYKIRGRGPLLVLLQGGAGDAEGFEDVATRLLDHFTIVTYDRRGLSRSTLDDPTAAPTIQTHSDDVHHLLAALATEPAFVAGFSFGALVGLDLVSRHPEHVRLLLAHEAPTPQLLPNPERSQAVQSQRDVEEAFRREGPAAAMQQFAALSGINFADREPGVEFPRPSAQYGANIQFFLRHDAPTARTYELDLAALEHTAARIVVASGSTNRDRWIHHCADALATALGAQFVEFPGGHNGFVTHPAAFAARLREVLGG
ncbi:MAG: alpha/beta hydrolase [Chloroflexi bacterium]|nr:alpha/beta hydrolase [Chloroflexota bacterium]